MSKLQYLTQTLFGQTYNDVQDLSDEQKGQVMVLKDVANAYMSTENLNFKEAVKLANQRLPEDGVFNAEIGFQIEQVQKNSMDPMAIIEAVQDYLVH